MMIGKSILHYRIIEKLGEGGMGVVYLADDTKLRRKVAIKFLPSHIAANITDRERFKIEAQAVAALNHPNIATIHNIEEDDNNIFIVMEYIKGNELKDIVVANDHSLLPIPQTINYSIQIAKGLHSAHKKGIIHRDIKSSNIMVTDEGNVKIMDFGLARIGEGSQLTRTHSTMGTMAYMSPEQVQGESADQQSDIWSFGVVLFEMLTGKLPFEGKNEPAVIYAITNNQPVFEEIENEALRAIVKKCLQKNKKNRYPSVSQILNNLQGEKEPSSVIAPVETQTEQKKKLQSTSFKWIAAISLVFLISLYFILFDIKQSDDLPPMKTSRFTNYTGEEYQPVFSPDGQTIAFCWDGPQRNNRDIYVKLIGTGNPIRLTTDPMPDIRPEWSRDANHIAFVREASPYPLKEIYIIPALGGREQKIVPFNPGLGEVPSISWSHDNKFIYYPSWDAKNNCFTIYKVSVASHEIEQVTSGAKKFYGDQLPRVSPDGKYLAFTRGAYIERDIFVLNLENNNIRKITQVNTAINGFSWGEDSRTILFAANIDGTSAVWQAGFSGDKLKKVASGVNINDPCLSMQGHRLVYAETIENVNIWKTDLRKQDKETLLIGSSTFKNLVPDISPDGTKILFCSNRTGTYNIWICDINGANQSQLTFFENSASGGYARWSHSGSEILIVFLNNLYVMDASGGTPIKIPNESSYANWAEDGNSIYGSLYPEYNIISFKKDGIIQQQITQEGGLFPYVFDDYIYYIKDWENWDIWRIPVKGGVEEPVLKGAVTMNNFMWAVVKKGIYFIHYDSDLGSVALKFYQFDTKKISFIKNMSMVFNNALAYIEIDPAERYMLYPKSEPTKSDIILVENFRTD